jgi:hypothetical protein
MAEDRDYKVGYGRPPLESRFKPGRSGNPKGRKPGSRNVSSAIRDALLRKVVVVENDRRQIITLLEAATRQLANKAAAGDLRATKLTIELLHQSEIREAAQAGTNTSISIEARATADAAILAAIRDQALQVAAGEAEETSPAAPEVSDDQA